jgi:hypothetical protein
MNEQQEREAFFRHVTSCAFIPEQPEELIEQVISFNRAAWLAWQASAKFQAARTLRQAGQEPVGTLHISHFRGLENTQFERVKDLSDGEYQLYTTPRPAPESMGLGKVNQLAKIHCKDYVNARHIVFTVGGLCSLIEDVQGIKAVKS